MKVLTVNTEKCTGCRLCELACSFVKSGSFNPLNSAIRVYYFYKKLEFVPLVCTQCRDAYCVKVCPTGSLYRNPETGIVEYNNALCIMCKQCMMACPWGSIKPNLTSDVMIKCDHCRGDPECVKYCPQGALLYLDVEDAVYFKQKETATKYLRGE